MATCEHSCPVCPTCAAFRKQVTRLERALVDRDDVTKKAEADSVKHYNLWRDELIAREAAEAKCERLDRVHEAAKEVWEVTQLRGDEDLPHPADDPKLWTARMQDAWCELDAALAEDGGGE